MWAGNWRQSLAVKQSVRDLQKSGVTPYVCTLCNVVFSSAQGGSHPCLQEFWRPSRVRAFSVPSTFACLSTLVRRSFFCCKRCL